MPLSPRRMLRTFKYAMFFDGIDDYVEIPHSSSYATTRHTVVITLMPTTHRYLIFSKGWWGNYRLLVYSTPYIELRITRRDRTSFIFPNIMEPRIGEWTTIAYWLDEYNASVAGAFKDGKFYSVTYIIDSSYPLCFECPNPLRIMGEPLTNFYYPGFIAQVLIYSRALSDSEIRWNYQHFENPVRDGLVLWLQADPQHVRDIDGDGVLEWVDLSGNGNHGKIYGATLVNLAKTPARVTPASRALGAVR
jgi:hypothetical protein